MPAVNSSGLPTIASTGSVPPRRSTGATSLATHGDLSPSASCRSRSPTGFGELLVAPSGAAESQAQGPGVIVVDGDGNPESLSPGAEHWIGQMVEIPPPATPAESKIVQAVAARAPAADPGQDHLKSLFTKTGVRSRGELVGQIFLEHYVPRWEDMADAPAGWVAKATPVPADLEAGSGLS